MSLRQRIAQWIGGPPPAEKRETINLAAWCEMVERATRTAAGVSVTEGNALRMTTVYACVRLLSESVASLPLHLYRRLPGGGKERLTEDPRYALLHDQPNPLMSSFTFRETLQAHLETWGNAYAWIERSKGGKVAALWPLRPDKVEAKIDDRTGRLSYTYEFRGEKLPEQPASSILHVPGLGWDGVKGYSPIGLMKNAIGMGLAAENYGSQFFGNAAMPSGILSTEQVLDDDAVERLKASWEAMHGGDNKWRVAMLGGGLTWTSIGIKPEEAQFLETRGYTDAQIARAYNIPAWMVGVESKGSMTYSNVEQQGLMYVTHCLRPRLVRLEQEINRKLLPEPTLFVEFNVDGLARGDLKSRYQAYAIAEGRWLTVNEIRELENRNPVEGGDEMRRPEPAAPPAAEGDPDAEKDPPQDDPEDEADAA